MRSMAFLVAVLADRRALGAWCPERKQGLTPPPAGGTDKECTRMVRKQGKSLVFGRPTPIGGDLPMW